MAEFRSEVVVRVDHEPGMFELVEPLRYYSDILGRELVVPVGYFTNFASIPWFLQSFVQVNGKHRPAAVVHDYLCDHGEALGIAQPVADQVFLEAMKCLDVRFSQRRVMYRFVRVYQTVKGWFV